MRRAIALSVLLYSVAAHAQAGSSSDALTWIQRIVSAARSLNYSGTFVYQNGNHTETSLLIHMLDGGVERERLEVLDGSPREVVRQDDEVRCFLPDERTVIIDRQARHKLSPARVPEAMGSLTQYYEIRQGKPGRIAGFDAETIILEPKDAFRYGHWLWAERASGLLLKARMVNARGEPIEQFAFTQLKIGGDIDRELLKSRYAQQPIAWQKQSTRSADLAADGGAWLFRGEVAGFKRHDSVMRQIGPSGQEAMHYLFSDGMATISVFIEPVASTERARSGHFRNGGTNVFRTVQGSRLITAVGEVPLETLRIIATGVEPKTH